MSEPTQLPKTEGARESTPLVSDTVTPAEAKIAELPYWLQQDIVTQVPVGGRNNHAMKIAPALMREGLTAKETHDVLTRLYPNAKPGELEGVVRRAEVYAQTEREQDPAWQAEHARLEGKRERAAARLERIIDRYPMEDFETELPDMELASQRREFLVRMFQPEDTIWIGDTTQSGPAYTHHFRTTRVWQDCCQIPGEFVSHCVFKPGSTHRNAESMAADKYMVLESDVLEPYELAAVARYLREVNHLLLMAIVTTGGKRHAPAPGMHWWFAHPGKTYEADWKATLSGYGADVATLRGPQPVRLPGIVRRDTGLKQELLWLTQ